MSPCPGDFSAEMRSESWALRDWRAVLHPFSSFEEGRKGQHTVFHRGEHIWLWDVDGNRYMDAFSGLMNASIGHGRAEVAEAAAAQMKQLAYVPSFFGFSNEPAITLAERLTAMAPGEAQKAYFVGSGSEATESAIKIARLFFALDGKPGKTHVITRDHSYHGSTYAAGAATGIPDNWDGIGPMPAGFSQIEKLSLEALEREIERIGPDSIAAFLAEPVALPSGVNIPTDAYWAGVQRLLRENDILLIVDEIVTGLGRTGKMFGSEHWSIDPDILLVAKGLSGGYTSLGAALVDGPIVDRLTEGLPLFRHGFTAGGNPASCAIAHSVLDVVEEEGLPDRARQIGDWMRTALADRLPDVEVRGLGLLVACDVSGMSETGGAELVAALKSERRILARAYGDVLVVGPPLSIRQEEAELLVEELVAVVDR